MSACTEHALEIASLVAGSGEGGLCVGGVVVAAADSADFTASPEPVVFKGFTIVEAGDAFDVDAAKATPEVMTLMTIADEIRVFRFMFFVLLSDVNPE